MKKLLKAFLLCALGFSAISTAAISSHSFAGSEKALADDQFFDDTPRWTLNSSDVSMNDNEGDGTCGYTWPWSSGNKRIHIYTSNDLLPSDLGDLVDATIANNGYKNSHGAVCYYTAAEGEQPSFRWMGFTARLLNHNVLSIDLGDKISPIIKKGDKITLNGQAYYANYASWDSGIGGFAKKSLEHSIQFNSISFEFNGRGWSKVGDIVNLDPSTFTSKTNDPWIVTGHNKPAGVNFVDYSNLPYAATWFKCTNAVEYHYANGTSETINAGLYVQGQWGHTFFAFTTTYTKKAANIDPKIGDYVVISGTWSASTGKAIVFTSSFTLSYCGDQWLLGEAVKKGTISQHTFIRTFTPNNNGQIYVMYNDAGIPSDPDWTKNFRSKSKIGTIHYANGDPDAAIYVTFAFYEATKSCLILESWATGLSANYLAASGDVVSMDGAVFRNNDYVVLDNLSFRYVDSTVGWVLINTEGDFVSSYDDLCQDAFLKTLIPGKIKNFDQCTTKGSEGGSLVYVKAQKDGGTVDALYFSHEASDWVGDGSGSDNYGFAEFRFPVSGNISYLNFSYKTNNKTTKRCPAADTKINNMNAYIEVKTADGGYGNATVETFDATVNDYEWQDVSICLGGVGAQNILFKFYQFVGDLVIANVSVTTVEQAGDLLSVSKMALGIQMDAQVDGSGNITAVNSSKTVMRFGVDLDIYDAFDNEVLEDIILSSGHAYGIADYGIQVNSKRYSLCKENTYRHFDIEDNLSYITVNLGDIMNSKEKLETEFTVSAYVEVKTGESTSTFSNYKAATYSVKGMVNYYVDNASTLGITGETLVNLQKIQAWIASVCA